MTSRRSHKSAVASAAWLSGRTVLWEHWWGYVGDAPGAPPEFAPSRRTSADHRHAWWRQVPAEAGQWTTTRRWRKQSMKSLSRPAPSDLRDQLTRSGWRDEGYQYGTMFRSRSTDLLGAGRFRHDRRDRLDSMRKGAFSNGSLMRLVSVPMVSLKISTCCRCVPAIMTTHPTPEWWRRARYT